jgi:hypothetical protein
MDSDKHKASLLVKTQGIFNIGIYSEVLLFCSTVMTTFPFLCPVSTYR